MVKVYSREIEDIQSDGIRLALERFRNECRRERIARQKIDEIKEGE